MHSRQEDQIFMIRVAQRQHDGSFLVIAWDPGILWIDSLATGTDGRTNCYFQVPPGVSTLPDNIVGDRCSASFLLAWDPRIIISFSLVQFVVPYGCCCRPYTHLQT
jgi:hypothetical protein